SSHPSKPVRQRSCHLPPDRKIVSKKTDPVHDLLILSGWFDRRKTTADITGHCRKRRCVTARPAKKAGK
ncbi:MAG: hypothetical protein VB135_01985, partial [Burkholderia sp.]